VSETYNIVLYCNRVVDRTTTTTSTSTTITTPRRPSVYLAKRACVRRTGGLRWVDAKVFDARCAGFSKTDRHAVVPRFRV